MINAMASDVATPSTESRGTAGILARPDVQAFAARSFAGLSRVLGKPIRLGDKVIVGRHQDVVDVLSRDLEFRIGPVNAAAIEAVNGPFVLGMDRDATLVRERAVLYRALARVDLAQLRDRVEQDANARISAAGDGIDVVAEYGRPVAGATAQTLFGITGPNDVLFMDVARAIFGHVFLNLAGDRDVEERAKRAAQLLGSWLTDEIRERRSGRRSRDDLMGALLSDTGVGDDLARRTLGGMLVGSIDTTATCVAKIIFVIGRDTALASGIAADVDDFARLRGWCWEALRRWPHNPIILRRAAVDTRISGVSVRVGDRVYLYTQAAMLDRSVFPDPQLANPDRPMRPYLHFGGGLHPCAGRDVNAFQIPLLIGALVRRGVRSVGAVRWAGPFPEHLPVTFNRAVP